MGRLSSTENQMFSTEGQTFGRESEEMPLNTTKEKWPRKEHLGNVRRQTEIIQVSTRVWYEARCEKEKGEGLKKIAEALRMGGDKREVR